MPTVFFIKAADCSERHVFDAVRPVVQRHFGRFGKVHPVGEVQAPPLVVAIVFEQEFFGFAELQHGKLGAFVSVRDAVREKQDIGEGRYAHTPPTPTPTTTRPRTLRWRQCPEAATLC